MLGVALLLFLLLLCCYGVASMLDPVPQPRWVRLAMWVLRVVAVGVAGLFIWIAWLMR